MRSIVLWPDEILKQKCETVRELDKGVADLAAEMISILDAAKGNGLAAVQIGVLQRMFVIHMQGGDPVVFVNPTIVQTAIGKVVYEEGCLSFLSVFTRVSRPRTVHIQAWNEKGKPFHLEADGWLARAILHEYDHLDGVVYVDHLTKGKRERVLAEYDRLARAEKGS